LVVSGTRSATPWAERKLDLRVEDSPAPIAELHRLVGLARAYDQMNQGDLATEHGDMAAAIDHYGAAARAVPDSAEMIYWQAMALAEHGQLDRALPLAHRVFTQDPAYRELTRRLPAAGLLNPAAATRLLAP
ncbi:MAG: Zn-dependent protease, partial [Proteobacteria bacterium]|nr:Zn-dependent protease [Pseudomonadota bacterium]